MDAVLDLNVGTLHAAGAVAGYARCGTEIGRPSVSGEPQMLAEHAARLCARCWPEWAGAQVLQ